MKLLHLLEKDYDESQPLNGLSDKQAKERLDRYGPNALRGKKAVSPFRIFAEQFKDVMVIILLICTAVSVFMGEYTEAIAIAVIVCVNAFLGFLQELKTEKTLEALKNMSAPVAKAYRNGEIVKIPTTELVPEDVILIEAGDRVPADAWLMESSSLESDESVLTGESVPVEKHADVSARTENLLNQPHLVYMGCTITKGHAKARVIATGMDTQMGKIADMLNEIEDEQTPLQKRLAQLGKYIAIGCLLVCVIVSVTGVLRGLPLFDMLITGVSLAVAAVPEGLPAIVTIALALAVNRMVKRNALIRKLHAVETLGCASVICSDKTGTLTQNKMTVKKLFTLDRTYEVTGDGAEKAGEFRTEGQRINLTLQEDTHRLLEVAALCNNAELMSDTKDTRRDRAVSSARGSFKTVGEPTESALLIMAAKAGVTPASLAADYTRLDEIPFDSDRKCMSVVVEAKNGQKYLMTKGACDVLLEKCAYAASGGKTSPLSAGQKRQVLEANEKMANDALRVLAFAFRPLMGDDRTEQQLIFLGLCGMIDPPRKEAKKAVNTCRKAGIKTIMITGDHKITACAIAKQIGIYHTGDRVFSGAELDDMDDEALTRVVTQTTVFARVSPHHKLRIVRALKRRGHVVAMTGDGVNDAPAIKEADIGVSMGNTGTDVTKEASDVILLDDNFATLVAAVEEGRVIYQNIRKFIRYLLSCNIGEVLTMFLSMLMGLPVVLLPIQILLINLVTDGLPAIALGLEPAEEGVMNRRPRRSDESVFSQGLLSTIIFRGILIGLTTLAVFVTLFKHTGSLDVARTGAFLTLVVTQLIHVFECKSETKSIFTVPYLNNLKLIGAVIVSAAIVLIAIYLPICRPIFSTVPLDAGALGVVFIYSFITPIVSAIIHRFKRKKGDVVIEAEED